MYIDHNYWHKIEAAFFISIIYSKLAYVVS